MRLRETRIELGAAVGADEGMTEENEPRPEFVDVDGTSTPVPRMVWPVVDVQVVFSGNPLPASGQRLCASQLRLMCSSYLKV